MGDPLEERAAIIHRAVKALVGVQPDGDRLQEVATGLLCDIASVANSLERIATLMERDVETEIGEQASVKRTEERKRSYIGKPVD